MLDIKVQSWYDVNATAVENTLSMQVYLIDNYDPMNLTDNQVTALAQFTAQLALMRDQEVKISTDFFTARDAAFAALSATQNQERIDNGILWQAKEDNGMDINYSPV